MPTRAEVAEVARQGLAAGLREAARNRRPPMADPWSTEDIFTHPTEIILAGSRSLMVHHAEACGVLRCDPDGRVWRRVYGSPELEQQAIRKWEDRGR